MQTEQQARPPQAQPRAEAFHITARKRMAELALRQHQLAAITGIGPSTLSAILNGRKPSHENLLKLLEALELHITAEVAR